ncbi:serine hydrolase domain-containing protein [Polaribacter glomeratus]|uniref:Serine hydrolase n=1 Tax=Polaribacter glomeratus TaxID=102 RepID=A0A2S7WX32_9FLAO|nr:serine hydrolase domain-containing protein [Polaribacter glomeratus]PQJ82160.1 serine hydrolase [Polaribacter glomeratus]TXD66755.1 beta-lactamase family protein [Polaribacter glomeratus]
MKKIYFIIFSLSLISNCYAQDEDQLLLEINTIENSLSKMVQIKGDSIKKYTILERMDFYKVPGVSIAIVQNRKIKWAKGYGYANTETGTKIDTETLFQAGSISKPLAALSALKLFENDSLELDKNVNYYLKNWQIPDNKFTKTEKVTIERLLTHTAGITVHGFPGYQQSDNFPDIIDVLNGNGNTAKIVVNMIPGSIWRYSGGGYTIMEKVVEDISGLTLEDYMHKNILQPMGMKNSTYQQPIAKKFQKNISSAYDENGKLIKGLWNNYPEQAAAGLWTTPSDLAKYCIEMQEILNSKKVGILTKATVEKMLTKHKNDWGLGPSLQNEKDSLIFGHGGKNAGFTNDMKAYAYQGNAIIVMTNADNGSKLISEIENSVSKYYNWSISKTKIIEVIKLSETDLKKYLGKYELKEENLILEVQLKESQLLITNTPLGDLNMIPISATKFIEPENGTVIEFLFDKKVNGFIVNNTFKLLKVN